MKEPPVHDVLDLREPEHARLLAERGIRSVDLTPAAEDVADVTAWLNPTRPASQVATKETLG